MIVKWNGTPTNLLLLKYHFAHGKLHETENNSLKEILADIFFFDHQKVSANFLRKTFYTIKVRVCD